MMTDTLTEDGIKYIVSRIIDYANDADKERKDNQDDAFYNGKWLAYTEMLNVLKNELDVRDADLKEYGLDFDIENR